MSEPACTPQRACPCGLAYGVEMLTRSAVAKRLGKSIATVRRMEGIELHPTRDERGVNPFDPAEVEQVAQTQRWGGARPHRIAGLDEYRRSVEEGDRDDDTSPFSDDSGEQSALDEMRELAAQMRHDAEMATRERQRMELLRASDEQRRREEVEQARAEHEELEEQLAELIDALDDDEWLDDDDD